MDSIDGAWPHRSIRAAIERLKSEDVENGLRIERHKMRGVYSKSIGQSGDDERGFASQARAWAKASSEYPRTAAMLEELAKSWERYAESEDVRAAKDRLRGRLIGCRVNWTSLAD